MYNAPTNGPDFSQASGDTPELSSKFSDKVGATLNNFLVLGAGTLKKTNNPNIFELSLEDGQLQLLEELFKYEASLPAGFPSGNQLKPLEKLIGQNEKVGNRIPQKSPLFKGYVGVEELEGYLGVDFIRKFAAGFKYLVGRPGEKAFFTRSEETDPAKLVTVTVKIFSLKGIESYLEFGLYNLHGLVGFLLRKVTKRS